MPDCREGEPSSRQHPRRCSACASRSRACIAARLAIVRAGTAACFPMQPFPFSLAKEDDSLAVEARESDDGTQARAVHEIEGDDFDLGHAVELAVQPEA